MEIFEKLVSSAKSVARAGAEVLLGMELARNILFTFIKVKFHFDLSEVCKVLELKLDSKQGIIQAKLELKGETVPLVIEELCFCIGECEGKPGLHIKSLRTNREWMNTLAGLACPTFVPLPSEALSVLSILK